MFCAAKLCFINATPLAKCSQLSRVFQETVAWPLYEETFPISTASCGRAPSVLMTDFLMLCIQHCCLFKYRMGVSACGQAGACHESAHQAHSLTCRPGFLPTLKRAWWESDLYQLLLPCRGRWGAWPFEPFLPYQRTTFEARAALFKTEIFVCLFFKFSPPGPKNAVLSAFTCQQQVCVLRSLLDCQPFKKEVSHNEFRSWALTKIGTEQVNSQVPCKSWKNLFKRISR